VGEGGARLVVPTATDAARIASVVNARSLALAGETEETTARIEAWFSLPHVDPDADMRLAVSDSGEAEGYADVAGPEDGTPRAWVDLRCLPGRADALRLLFGFAQTRGAERVGPGGLIRFPVDAEDVALRKLLDDAGYAVVRSSYTMERSLVGTPERPAWPTGIETRPFDVRDAAAVHAAENEAFADHWDYAPSSFETWRALNLGPEADLSLIRVAWAGEEIAGLCITRSRRGEDDSVGWVGVLGVRRPWRRRGLGEALLRDAFVLLAERGKRAVGLGVDSDNTTGAVALYERVGMHVTRRSDSWQRAV
jgi:ribosomal protein S18 acetylase RimI-like enzyme